MDKKALIMGWFSTVGDIECLKIVTSWLDQLEIHYDIGPYSEKIRTALPGTYNPQYR